MASLNQSLGPMYDNLAYDEDSHLHCLESTKGCLGPTQHSWVLAPR